MATTKITMDERLRHTQQVRRFLNAVEELLDSGEDLTLSIPTMIDGDGSNDAHYSQVTDLHGFQNTTKAHEFWLELQSVWSKVSGNGSVADVNAALKQIIAKCR